MITYEKPNKKVALRKNPMYLNLHFTTKRIIPEFVKRTYFQNINTHPKIGIILRL